MQGLEGVVAGASVIGATGLLALMLCAAPRLATGIATGGAAIGGAFGLAAAVLALTNGSVGEIGLAWAVPGGKLLLGIDPLSAFFLAPLFALGALCAIYGRSYLGARTLAAAELNLLIAFMALVLLARHALVFLLAWEAMTLLAYVLITFDHAQAEVRRAGWVYLIASHLAVTALIALFLALSARSHGALAFSDLSIIGKHLATAGAVGLLALALIGFGVKAGVVGLHVWLPEAHAAAPSHVSALMSAVLIKLGLYGVLRATFLIPPGAWFGVLLMILGAAGALFAIVLALNQRDLKRTLAYSSVENVGIILLCLGLGFWARAHGDPRLAAMAFAGGLLHVWNHAAMKGLLFLAAGSIVHGAQTRDIEGLGGLLPRMPQSGRCMVIGALAITGLPPLNGFMSEWLLYRALAQVGARSAGGAGLAAIAGAALLALVGGLSALCFVRLLGIVLLGNPRSEGAARAHESPAPMTLVLGVLAAVCVLASLAASGLVSTQTKLLTQLTGGDALDTAAAARYLAPLNGINGALFAAIALAAIWLARQATRAEACETWGCGYAAPTPRMQYSGRAFSELLGTRVLPRWLRARLRVSPPTGLFPVSAAFASDATDPITRAVYEPFLVRWGDRFARLRFVQQGNVHIYILYILATAIFALTWVAARDWLAQ